MGSSVLLGRCSCFLGKSKSKSSSSSCLLVCVCTPKRRAAASSVFKKRRMMMNCCARSSSRSSSRVWSSAGADAGAGAVRKLPVVLWDVMDTIVRDPFYHDVPAFFGLTMEELMKVKHPTAWNEFEKGAISEEEFLMKFFRDGGSFDYNGLKQCMKNGYEYIDGIKDILEILKSNGYEMHAFTNYPCWYKMIEEKLELSKYISWNFSSCNLGRRKPEKEAYLEVLKQLNVSPSSCIFIDDRSENVDAALNLGISGIVFETARKLEHDLTSLGIDLRSVSQLLSPQRSTEETR